VINDFGRKPEQDRRDRQFGNWRVTVSAWVLVLLFMMLLAAVEAVACRRGVSHAGGHFAGAVIPQHDPCVGPGIPSAANVDGCKSAPLGGDRYAYW
jgi:hypothetical protein